MPDRVTTRLTQRDIARLAKVSQTTVSLVLNNRVEASARIPAATRDRVLKVIRETGYVADPLARRMQQQRNQILGVFTYESVFPSASGDFYHPFLAGIEDCAEQLGWDLLLFTSAPVTEGRRQIFHQNNRLRIADGCLLLGRRIPAEELSRLIAEEYPFVSVGRRDEAGAPVPYVGADYAAATATVVERAKALGHRRIAFVGPGVGAESSADRLRGFRQAAGPRARHEPTGDRNPADVLDTLLDQRITAAFVEDRADAVALVDAAAAGGIDVPAELSVIALGDPTRPADTDIDFSGFHVPRREMGRQATELLEAILSGQAEAGSQRLIPCELVDGTTLTTPKGS
ncbi:DNA-binding LacI/PurR family transcriptional regulator [Kribbella sp. VKM Ac-2527]|uniref:DNA-binding LacI/PurR family transcriptional regulator n=1 Tax=Kribbella caucasensis TaxID=2512215 RepID=A0A4R6K1Q6_9ACTN|nr:LacI family DNA-binding transcriptional regulator [Kribbella sp. VKM Ac-2527]TDO43193.1 DNA-binding LacI/PurR family transcriptional regulator [Kribbella sp. VKM Ac-2527]